MNVFLAYPSPRMVSYFLSFLLMSGSSSPLCVPDWTTIPFLSAAILLLIYGPCCFSLLFDFYSTKGFEVLILISFFPNSLYSPVLQSLGLFPFGGHHCAISYTCAWDAKPSSASVACPSHPMWSEVSGSSSRNFAGLHMWVQHVLSVYVICHTRWHVVLQISTNILECLVVTQ